LADEEPVDMDAEPDAVGNDGDDDWPTLSPLELAVCLTDGQIPAVERHPDNLTAPAA
jgi:hypothetical protein